MLNQLCYTGQVYGPLGAIYRLENTFLRKLLAVSQSINVTIVHKELGLPYISDKACYKTLILWHSIWTKPEILFTKATLRDCLTLDYALKIP